MIDAVVPGSPLKIDSIEQFYTDSLSDERRSETRPPFAFLAGTSVARKSAGVHLFVTQVPFWASVRPSLMSMNG